MRNRTTPLPYILFNHQQKAQAFVQALSPIYTPIPRTDRRYKSARFVLSDNHVLTRGTRLEVLRRDGLRNFFIYPHAARPSLISAFYPPWKHITAQFVVNETHIEVMRRIGCTETLYPVGWALCPIIPFRPRSELKQVLFGPIHPRNSNVDKQANRAVTDRLYPLAIKGEIYLTVRYLPPFDGNGIKKVEHPNIKYIEGAAGPATTLEQIDQADLVVGHQTFGFLAVARGVPTLMFGESMTPHVEMRDGTFTEARGWNDIKDLIVYPLDILDSEDPMSLMWKTASDDSPIAGWRDRMIGEAFDPGRFMKILRGCLRF